MSINLQPPLSTYFAAKNAHDVDAILDVFSDKASVRDEGRTMIGRDAIRDWLNEVTRKFRVTMTPTGVDQEPKGRP